MKRSRDASQDADASALIPDAKRAHLLHNPASGGGWDDLVDDAKKEIRRQCVPYVQRMLGMTCKAERAAVATAPSPYKFVLGLVKYDELRLLKIMGNKHVLATDADLDGFTDGSMHDGIIHCAMRRGSRELVEWLIDGHNPWIPILPCVTCFRLCYERAWLGMDDALVQMFINGRIDCPGYVDHLEDIQAILRLEADDDTFGIWMRMFG